MLWLADGCPSENVRNSLDTTPIELVFSKIKHLLRNMASRTRDALWNTMQSVLDQITLYDATNCFLHCEYTPRMEYVRSRVYASGGTPAVFGRSNALHALTWALRSANRLPPIRRLHITCP